MKDTWKENDATPQIQDWLAEPNRGVAGGWGPVGNGRTGHGLGPTREPIGSGIASTVCPEADT